MNCFNPLNLETMKRIEGSGRPGNNFDSRGIRIAVYEGRHREPPDNWQKYLDEDYSERRRKELRTQLGARILLNSLKPEIKAHIRLTKILKT